MGFIEQSYWNVVDLQVVEEFGLSVLDPSGIPK
jgi:hypothetical protein